jgi:hypothetical protein
MKYFTREQHDGYNSNDRHTAAATAEQFKLSCELYRRQLDELKSRLNEDSWVFFDSVSLHDGTLLAVRIGDDIDKRFPDYKTRLVNRRRLSVEVEALNYDETRLYTLRYEGLHRVQLDFPSSEPWYARFSDRGSNPMDDWIADELTAVDEQVLRHEVLFSSGATLLLDFEHVSVGTSKVEGRKDLPYLD